MNLRTLRWAVAAVACVAPLHGCGGDKGSASHVAKQVPGLIEELKVAKSPNDWNRRNLAASRLGRMGAMAGSAVDELSRVAKDDPNPTVRKTASEALEKIRGPQS